jgi:CubicO group peptidase (beta-lactamase class C family)
MLRLLTHIFLLPGLLLMLMTSGQNQPQQRAVFDRAVSDRSNFDPAAVDRFITSEMRAQRLPGLALAITQGGQVLYVKGYGTDGYGKPVTPQTRFFIASVSKSFTALAVMQLVEAGKVDLDAPVQKYLPEFTLADPNVAARITIRHLLNHTSGLNEPGFPDMVLPQPQTIAERVTSLRSARPVAQPGTEYHYFSPNYGTLARVVEVVSGQPFSEYMQEHIFAPLAMENTLNVVTSNEGKRAGGEMLAKGHLEIFGMPVAYPEADGYLGGSGGLISTAEDMTHYLIVQNNGGRYQGQALLSPASVELMHKPPAGINSTYAMGWTESISHGKRMLEHNGILSTYSADAILLPDEGIGITLLYNISSLPTNTFAAPEIRDGLVALLAEQQPKTSWMNVHAWGWITALLTLGGGALAVRSLLRLPRWREKARTTSRWRLLPGIAWAFVPGLALLGFPALTAQFADRVFGFVNFYKSMPGIFAWLGLTGLLGAVNGTARIAMLLYHIHH